jgi:hypothetical protein
VQDLQRKRETRFRFFSHLDLWIPLGISIKTKFSTHGGVTEDNKGIKDKAGGLIILLSTLHPFLN